MEKIRFTPLDDNLEPRPNEDFDVLFNPESYSVSRTVNWSSGEKDKTSDNQLNAPPLSFGGGHSRTLSLELFYDVTEQPENRPQPLRDVREETNKLVRLTMIDRRLQEKRPPTVRVSWGGNGPQDSDFPFLGVISSLNQRFTLFREDGTPVRATLSVQMTEFIEKRKALLKSDPELTTFTLKRGDNLSAVAARQYGDPSLWRVIAEANNIDDPRQLQAGRSLAVPKQ